MDDKPLTCGKCGTLLEINAAHVTFRGGKKAYIRCGKCNSVRRIAYDVVEHLLKSNSEAVKPVKPETSQRNFVCETKDAWERSPEDHDHLASHPPKEQPVKSPSAEPEPVKQETTEKEQEINAPEGVIWGAIAAVLAVIVSIVGILWYWWKNRKEGEAT